MTFNFRYIVKDATGIVAGFNYRADAEKFMEVGGWANLELVKQW